MNSPSTSSAGAASAFTSSGMATIGSTGVLDHIELPLTGRREGKIRISYELPASGDTPERRLFITTDRLSAFDRVLACVPGKGQVLNELAWWWFGELADIVPNHALSLPDPNVLIATAAAPLPVEVIVRHAITGVTNTSLWQRYAAGQRVIDGHTLPDGLHKNELLPTPIITPTTKAEAGGHDEPLSVADVEARGLVAPALWEQVCAAALAIFERGSQRAQAAGLILADTKYEFGLAPDGTLLLIDEVHTPDSSRFWEGANYESRLAAGEEPESMDKEIVRRAFVDLGYRGDGPIPTLDPAVWVATANGYQRAYERLTGRSFVSAEQPAVARIHRSLHAAGFLPDPGSRDQSSTNPSSTTSSSTNPSKDL
jgi:phosphoribosylaminoimidazole-succinocarboxamide synthase